MNYDILIKFDLAKRLEKNLNSEQFTDFFATYQDIIIADQFIRDCPAFPGSTNDIINEELMSVVGATLAIEGTTLRQEEIKESFIKADLNQKLKDKEQEAQNSRSAYKYIIDAVDNNKGKFFHSEVHIKKIHELLTSNVESISPNMPGQYRTLKATFGHPRKHSFCRTKTQINTAMSSLIDWLNKDGGGLITGNPIVKAIMAHYYLTEIHPFGDGNGRTARALEALVLYAERINTYCFWSLANFWNAKRTEYVVQLGNIRGTCDPWSFLILGTKGYLEEIKRIKASVLKKVKQLMLMDYVRWLLDTKLQQNRENKINQRIFGVMRLLTRSDEMPLDKFRSSPAYESLYSNKTAMTKSRDINKMKAIGLINVFEKDKKTFIEPRYQILDQLTYSV
jgi:Fic family protein